jgi:hypothetical protein
MEDGTMIEGMHEPTLEEKEDLFRNEEPQDPSYCDHTWITAEHVDMPADTGYITNITKLYCTKCDQMKEVKWQ